MSDPLRSLAGGEVGDGLQTALFLLEAMVESEKVLSSLVEGFERYPQILVNVEVNEKVPFDEIEGLSELKRDVEERLDGTGRLLLRYSGTEKLARVMIEGQDQDEIEEMSESIAEAIRKAIGSEDE